MTDEGGVMAILFGRAACPGKEVSRMGLGDRY